MNDLLAAIALTLSAAIVIGTLAASRASPRDAGNTGAALAAWFALVVTLGALGTFDFRGGLGTPGLGLAVVLPVLALAYAGMRLARLKAAVLAIPVPLLIAVNGVRVLPGVFFLLLYAAGRLPSPFAPVAGEGDVFIGLTALPLAWAVARQVPGWRGPALAWNTLGLLDLVAAIGLGTASAEGSPVRLFWSEPSSAIMGTLPWVIIPGFIVPLLVLMHLVLFYRLGAPAPQLPARHASP